MPQKRQEMGYNWKKIPYGKREERYGTISEKTQAEKACYIGTEFRPPNCGLDFNVYRFKCSVESFCIDEKPQGRLNLKKMQNLESIMLIGTFEIAKL